MVQTYLERYDLTLDLDADKKALAKVASSRALPAMFKLETSAARCLRLACEGSPQDLRHGLSPNCPHLFVSKQTGLKLPIKHNYDANEEAQMTLIDRHACQGANEEARAQVASPIDRQNACHHHARSATN